MAAKRGDSSAGCVCPFLIFLARHSRAGFPPRADHPKATALLVELRISYTERIVELLEFE